MLEKVSNILGSVRFWQLSFATAFVLLGHYYPGMEFLWNTLAGFLATVVTVGTADSVATKLSK